jgi:hypothetical protein
MPLLPVIVSKDEFATLLLADSWLVHEIDYHQAC